MEIKLKRIKKH